MKEVYIGCVVFMGINIFLNSFCRDDLFEMGVEFIINLQRIYRSPLMDNFFVMVTTLIDPAVVLLLAVMLLILIRNKFKAFVILLYIVGNTYLTGVLKAFYADPRPIWVSENVSNIGFYCPQEYGNPSGHSWFSMVLTFGVFVENFGVGKYYWKVSCSLLACILIPFSRMYLGAHSLNQVVQGITMGLAMNILYIFGLQNQIKRFLRHFNEKHYRMLYWGCIVICHATYFTAYILNSKYDIPQNWKVNILSKCNKLVDKQHLNFMMLMINSLLVNVITGIGLGFSYLVNRPEGRLYLAGNWTINCPQGKNRFVRYIAYFMTEFMTLAFPFILAGLLLLVLGGHFCIFVICNIAALSAGFFYTKCASQILLQNNLINLDKSIKESDKHQTSDQSKEQIDKEGVKKLKDNAEVDVKKQKDN